jgi:rare lipoprotein A
MCSSRTALALGVAVVLATTGCAPRLAIPGAPAPDLAPLAREEVAPIDTTPVAVLQSGRAEGVLEIITGIASYYANSLAGRPTASGEPYDPASFIAAHRDLPFGSMLRVTNPANGLSVEVRVIDRGPFTEGRVIDLSRSAAEALDMVRQGILAVRIEVLSYGH